MSIRDLIPFGKKNVTVKHEEENPFLALRRDMDSLFDDFFKGFEAGSLSARLGAFVPKVDITETEKEIRMSVEVPGMDEKDIEVSVNRDTLTIRGEKKVEKEDKTKDYFRMERSYGSFSRTLALPAEVETDKIEAQIKKGVLDIRLPKSPKAIAETKKIEIKTE